MVAEPNRERAETIRSLGMRVIELDDTDYMRFSFATRLHKFIVRSQWRFPERVVNDYNSRFLQLIRSEEPDIVWMEKALLLLPETLSEARRILPSTTFASWLDDNPFGLRKVELPIWRNFVRLLDLYDIHFVKRERDIETFKAHGAKCVDMIRLGFFSFHRPYEPAHIPAQFKHDVIFIGSAIDDRATAISWLQDTARLRVDVYGERWNRYWVYYRFRDRFHGRASSQSYSRIVSGSKISLGYVSSSNLDEYTNRSADIPACGGFLLAKRTAAHQAMYDEGKEAEFFGSNEECADKIRFYLHHDELRKKIARAGYERCIRSDYSLKSYAKSAMKRILELREGALTNSSDRLLRAVDPK